MAKDRVARRSREIDMLNGPLVGKILEFSIPLAFASILQTLFTSADSAFAGQYLGETALAGIGSVGSVTALLVGLFLGLSMGSNVTIALRIGQGDAEGTSRALHTSAAVALASSVVLTVVGIVFVGPILDATGVPVEARDEAEEYLRAYFAGICCYIIYDFSAAALRAKGDTRLPLVALGAGAALNVVLNYIAMKLGLGVSGLAATTVISNGLAAAILVGSLMRGQEPLRLVPSAIRFHPEELKHILSVGVPSGVQGMVFSLSNVVIQSAINSLGTDAMAANAAEMNFESLSYYFMNSFSQAAVTFVGQNYAAGKTDRVDKTVALCIGLGLGITFALDCCFFMCRGPLLAIFTDDPVVTELALQRFVMVLMPHCTMTTFEVPAGSMRGMGHATVPAVVSLLGTCVLRLAYVFWIFPVNNSYWALLAVYPISWAVTAVVMAILYVFVRKRAFARRLG